MEDMSLEEVEDLAEVRLYQDISMIQTPLPIQCSTPEGLQSLLSKTIVSEVPVAPQLSLQLESIGEDEMVIYAQGSTLKFVRAQKNPLTDPQKAWQSRWIA